MKLSFILFVSILLLTPSVRGDGCQEDFSPCTCTPFEESVINVECIEVASADIKEAFRRTSTTNYIRLFLTLSGNSSQLPSDLLGDNRAQEVDLTCTNRNFDVKVDRFAFRNSAWSTLDLLVFGCSLSQLEFAFLTGYQAIRAIEITNSTFPSLSDLPRLPSLRYLVISDCPGFTTWGKPDLSSVVELRLGDNLLGDQAVDEILNSILAITSRPPLQTLILMNNQLTRIPEMVPLFPNLITLSMDVNTIPVLKAGSLALSAPDIHMLRLEVLSLRTIEPGAFQGYFGLAIIQVNGNRLTTVDELVFRDMLEDMVNSNSTMGFLEFYPNPIECDCGLAWLFRDNGRLLKRVTGACSNETFFETLDPAGFAHCGA